MIPLRKNKYGARKTVVDGIEFASKKEANYYATLKLRERAGEVHDVQLQPLFPITIRGILITVPRMDFSFWDDVEKRERVIDVKGKDNSESKLKRKLVEAAYNIKVELA